MHSIFLSEKVLFRQLKTDADTDSQIKGGKSIEEIENQLLKRFAKQHKDVHFDRLPSCPLCLEKLDAAVTGLQPAPSQLVKPQASESEQSNQAQIWPDVANGSCLVCKYETAEMTEDHIKCQVCENRKNLWICIICGYIGCGRYFEKHAVNHSDNTLHNFSLEFSSHRIWNYKGDNYVHRMIRSAFLESGYSTGA